MEFKFSEIFEIIDGDRGKNYPKDADFFDQEYCLFLNAGNVTKNGWSFENVHFINGEKDKSLRKGKLNRGDLVLTTRGTVGNVCHYDESVPYKNVRINSGMVILKIKDKKILTEKFAYYLLKSEWMSKLITLFCSGSAQPQLPIKDFVKIKTELPIIERQNMIVNMASKYDELIELNNRRIKLLEQTAEELYKEWFVRFRFPNYQNTEFENGIPKGWKIMKLGEIANVSTGKSNRQDADENGQYPFFDRSQDIKRSNIWLKDCEAIIIPGEGTSFIPRYYYGKFDLHQRCYCVEPRFKDTGMFLYYVLLLNRHYFLSVATGATVPSLRQNNFLSMKFIMPPMDLCVKFNGIVSKNNDEINFLRLQNENLIKQRDLLLPRLMSGKLEVK